MKTHLLCIDPGVSGGCVFRVLVDRPGVLPDDIVVRPFTSAVETAGWVAGLLAFFKADGIQVVMESVHASPVMSQSSAFAFGENFGLWKGILAGAGFGSPHGVSPQQWQLSLAKHSAGLEGSERKSALNRLCKQRHPSLHVTLKTCDAILISDFVVDHFKSRGVPPGKLL